MTPSATAGSHARPPDALPPLLIAAGLGLQRGADWLFQGVDLELRPGEVTWLRGRNGCGKTSLLRVLAGLTTPSAGTVLVDGSAMATLAPAGRQRLRYLAHASALKDDLTVAENLQLAAQLQGGDASAAAVEQALHMLGLHGLRHRPVRLTSQGQRRRTALARLALPQPAAIWLLDEPYDALDQAGVQTLGALISARAERGSSVLMTSHTPFSLGAPQPARLALDLDHHAAVPA